MPLGKVSARHTSLKIVGADRNYVYITAILLVQQAVNLPEVQYADPTDSSTEVVASYSVVTTAHYGVSTAIGDGGQQAPVLQEGGGRVDCEDCVLSNKYGPMKWKKMK